MSDGMSDAYRMENNANEKQNIHLKLLKLSDNYAMVCNSLNEQYNLLKTTQSAISIMEKQKEEMLQNYIHNIKT